MVRSWPEAYYLSEDEKQAEINRESAVVEYFFNDGEEPVAKDTSDATLERLRALMKKTLRRTILVPFNHKSIGALHKLNRWMF